MNTKICLKCKKSKILNEFSINNSKKGGLNSYCRECHKIARKIHYEKNQKKYIKKSAEYTEKIKEKIRNIKKDKPCHDCGKIYPSYVMDFDHVKGIKISEVGYLAHRGSLRKAKEEIEKCELVCANCHRERTYQRKYH